MNKRRLLKLADLLEADAANKKGAAFDLGTWAKKKDEDGYYDAYAFTPGETVPVSCNTAACAWGLAAISGAFKRSGVGYKIEDNGYLVPTYDDLEDFDAAEAFFDINETQADFLFEGIHYPDNKTKGAAGERYVAKRIRDFVAGKVAP